MTRHLLATVAFLSAVIPSHAHSQISSPQRARQIAALFTKEKHVIKEKRGVRAEKYKRVSAETVVAANPTSFSGTYRALSSDFVIRLSVSNSGRVEGSGEDALDFGSRSSRPFTLANGKVDGALFTATKVFRDGARESIEGVFIERTSYESPQDPGTKAFGLGLLTKPMQIDGNNIDRLFYERASGQMAQGNTGNR